MLYSGKGIILDWLNKTEQAQDASYACITAREVVLCTVAIDGVIWDQVYVGRGGSHSWWTAAQGKFLPAQGLLPQQRLTVSVDGEAALRVDWV